MEYHDVLLLNPPSKQKQVYEHLGLGYLAAFLRERNIDVKILNMPHWTVPQAFKEIKTFNCKILGVSIPFQKGAELAFKLISYLKKAEFQAHVVIGGIYPTFCYEEIMGIFPEVDSVVLGEGEETFTELAEFIIDDEDWRQVEGIAFRKNGKIVTTGLRPLIKDLDTIPFPERDVLPEVLPTLGYAPMLTSRGCYGRCSFCSVVPFFSKCGGPKYRMRSSRNVMEELEILHDKYNVSNVEFNDANFIGGKGRGYKRALEIAEGILKRNFDLRFSIQCRPDEVDEELFTILKRAGLSKVFLGVESGSQSVLDRFQKDITVEENLKALEILNKLDLIVLMGFITFDNRTTLKELNENLMFIQKARRIMSKSKLYYDLGTKLLPLAGSEAEKYLKETKKMAGNSLRFSYKLEDPRVSLMYSMFRVADGLYRVKREMRDFDREWTVRQ